MDLLQLLLCACQQLNKTQTLAVIETEIPLPLLERYFHMFYWTSFKDLWCYNFSFCALSISHMAITNVTIMVL